MRDEAPKLIIASQQNSKATLQDSLELCHTVDDIEPALP